MTLTQLKYVIALDTYKNFAIAAQHCFVAQPSLSLQVKKLEQELRVELFDRSSNPIKTTEMGDTFVTHARRIMDQVNELTDLCQPTSFDLKGEFKIGIIPTIACYLLAPLLNQVQSLHPELDLWVSELTTSQILEQLEQNRLDVGIVALPLQARNFDEHIVYYESFDVYVPNSFQSENKTMKISELKNYTVLLLGDEHCFRSQTLKICQNASYKRIACNSLETIKQLVDLGKGITLLPEFYLNSKDKRVMHFSDSIPCRAVGFITKKQFFKARHLKAIQEQIEKIIPNQAKKLNGRKVIGIDVDI